MVTAYEIDSYMIRVKR